jgi:hypothetical protein
LLIILKGTTGDEMYLVLDGTAVLYGINKDYIGFLKPGGHYQHQEELCQTDENKRLSYLIAK